VRRRGFLGAIVAAATALVAPRAAAAPKVLHGPTQVYEDMGGHIYNVYPEDTPFIAWTRDLPRRIDQHEYHEWQYDVTNDGIGYKPTLRL
jgi:hypothetical protein